MRLANALQFAAVLCLALAGLFLIEAVSERAAWFVASGLLLGGIAQIIQERHQAHGEAKQ